MSTRRQAIVVRGGWDGHQPVETTDLVIPFLVEHGFEVAIESSPAVYADEARMAEVDLVVQNMTMSTIEGDQVDGLRRAVENGTGLAGWHGGIADAYRASDRYLQLVGGQFAAHAAKAPDELTGEQSDNYRLHTIHVVPEAADHPIMRGISDFDLVTEQYWVLSDDLNDVLATTTQEARPFDPWHRPVTSPAVWTRLWGEGRVFVATPGHRVDILEEPNVRTIVERGMLWAARGGDDA